MVAYPLGTPDPRDSMESSIRGRRSGIRAGSWLLGYPLLGEHNKNSKFIKIGYIGNIILDGEDCDII